MLERPVSYAGYGAIQSDGPLHGGYQSHGRRPSGHDEYDRLSESTIADSYGEGHYDAQDNTIPIVQRESSLTRLQEAFADHGASVRPVTEVNLPQLGTPRHPIPEMLPQNVPVPPVGQIHSQPELRNAYAEQHLPMLVPNMTATSHHADIIGSQSRRSREKQPQYRTSDERERVSSRYNSEPRGDYRSRPRRVSSY